MLPLETICQQACKLIKETGIFIQNESKNISREDISIKSKNNFVTAVDTEAEKKLVAGLKIILPEAGFLTEEKTIQTSEQELKWIIDPIDGTTNFIYGIPCYSVSVALVNKEDILIGIVFAINADECFYAWKNGGAYLNGGKITVSAASVLSDSLLATGFPFHVFDKIEDYILILKELMRISRGIRRLGSAAIDLAYTACGRFDGFYEYGLSPWDVAGGILLIKEAGGCVSDFKGKGNYLFGGEIIAGNGMINKELLRIITSFGS